MAYAADWLLYVFAVMAVSVFAGFVIRNFVGEVEAGVGTRLTHWESFHIKSSFRSLSYTIRPLSAAASDEVKAVAVRWAVVSFGSRNPWLLVGDSTCSAAFGFGVVVPTANVLFCAKVVPTIMMVAMNRKPERIK